ncbi:hypothetical protein [Pandoraea sp. SD6-2]|uniref:hypothetical protein n=1 Tax=Pandoraea sp. SD6-2 TaxID=1286093 RepID=UPI0011859906|nr:hypothetical protein [Pandoraea sp. SD6-2]
MGTYHFNAGATDANNHGGQATGSNGWFNYSLNVVVPPPPLDVSFTGKSFGKVHTDYAGTLSVNGGVPPYVITKRKTPTFLIWSKKSETSEIVTGQPKSPGLAELDILVTDAAGHSVEIMRDLEIASAPSDLEKSPFVKISAFVNGDGGSRSLHVKGVGIYDIKRFGISWTGHAEVNSDRIRWSQPIPSPDNGWAFDFSTLVAALTEPLYPLLFAELTCGGTQLAEHFVFPTGEGLFDVVAQVVIAEGSPKTVPMEGTGSMRKSAPFHVKAGENLRVEFTVTPAVGLRYVNVDAALVGTHLARQNNGAVSVAPAADLLKQPEDSKRLERWNGTNNTQVLALDNIPANKSFTVVLPIEGVVGECSVKFTLSDPENIGTSLNSSFEKEVNFVLRLLGNT